MVRDKKYLIIFDWDGVIADSGGYYFDLYRKICAKYNKVFPPKTLDEFRDWYDSEWENNVYNLGFSEDMVSVINDDIGKMVDYDDIHFFSDSKEMILTLGKDYHLAVASTTPSVKIRKELENSDLDEYFPIVSGGDDGKSEKTLKIKKVIDFYQISPENALMVGDTAMDLLSARALGIKAIGIVTGLNSRKKLEKENPYLIVETQRELIDSIYRIFPRS